MKIQLKEKKLTYFSISSDENIVCIRGRSKSHKIDLPEEWVEFVDLTSITVHLTPIGANQNLIVKRIQGLEVHLQTNGMSVDCFYVIFGKVLDTSTSPCYDT